MASPLRLHGGKLIMKHISITYHMSREGEIAETCIILPMEDQIASDILEHQGEKPARQGGRLWYYRSQDHFDVSCGIAGLYGCQLLHGHGGRIMVETEASLDFGKACGAVKEAEHR